MVEYDYTYILPPKYYYPSCTESIVFDIHMGIIHMGITHMGSIHMGYTHAHGFIIFYSILITTSKK